MSENVSTQSYNLQVESKKPELTERTEGRMVRSRGSREMVARGYKLPVIRSINSGNLCKQGDIVNNTVLYT